MMEEELYEELENCSLCPRNCGVNRNRGAVGYCGETAVLRAARAYLHMWEEPCISGSRGSGTVFFTGCSLKCIFCQNAPLAEGQTGKEISAKRLAEIFLEQQERGAHNINLVTPTHFLPQIVRALEQAKNMGLGIPVVYNTGGYEKAESIRSLQGLVDIYLPDFKYWSPELAKRYSEAPDYPKWAMEALAEMYRQVGPPVFEEKDGLMKKGIIVRHLLLPGQTEDSKKIVGYLYETYGDNIFVSLMNQYTPMPGVEELCPELGRRVTRREYDRLVDYAIDIGLSNGFIQEGRTAEESFIPLWNLEGI